jgi:hypothetical protein
LRKSSAEFRAACWCVPEPTFASGEPTMTTTDTVNRPSVAASTVAPPGATGVPSLLRSVPE